jgi:hypothetical protein
MTAHGKRTIGHGGCRDSEMEQLLDNRISAEFGRCHATLYVIIGKKDMVDVRT